MGEIEWIDFLSDQGLPVCKCVQSIYGNLVEVIDDGKGDDGLRFLAIAYIRAVGQHPGEDDWNGDLYERLGELVGQVHKVTQAHRVSQSRFKRQDWYDEEQLKASKYLPSSDNDVVAFIESRVAELKRLPRDVTSYGLVHGDIGYPNFFVTDGSVQLFDFDDIGYYYFIHDIAIVLYHALNYPPRKPENIASYVAQFFERFMAGYKKYNQLERFWFVYLPDFINLRHALQYVIFHKAFDREALDARGRTLLARHRKQVLDGLETARIVKTIVDTQEC